MPISMQAARVNSCDILMGPHGAGMVHGLWMYPGSVVIEIMDPEHFPAGYYRNIAHLSGHIYFKHRKEELEQPEPTKTKIFEQILVTAAEIISNKAAFSRVVTLQKSCAGGLRSFSISEQSMILWFQKLQLQEWEKHLFRF